MDIIEGAEVGVPGGHTNHKTKANCVETTDKERGTIQTVEVHVHHTTIVKRTFKYDI